ncbi:MAG TPA: PKD domain-containing protein [Telluria sp.]|nr:PKD domain-containing protein [Telluria sp.]
MMKILWKETSRHVAGAAFGAALCIAAAPGYAGAAPAIGKVPDAVAGSCHCAADSYAIVNLVPGIGYRTRINTRGQAAFEYVSAAGRLRVGFFDGERMRDIVPPGADGAALGDMNAKGEVALYSALPSDTGFNLMPFRWSRAAGFTLLPVLSKDGDTFLGAINDHGFIIGASGIAPGEAGFRGVRWSPSNSLLKLPTPAGFGESIVSEINEHDVSVGFASDPAKVMHALIWDAAGRPTDLGTLGAGEAAGLVNNNRGEIAGWLDVSGPEFQSFLWSPGKGVTRVGRHTVPGDLNNVGELVGRIYFPDTGIDHAFLFSRARGLVDLHRSPFTSSDASQADDKGTVVGSMSSNIAGSFSQRAYRWSRSGEAIDLNSLLRDAPDGLVVTQSLRLASNGDIIATSNAGLILLRRAGGAGGTDAPVLGPISLPEVIRPAEPIALSLSFRDRNKGDSHSATVDWGDGSGPQVAAISERKGRGELSAAHTYACAGDYNVVVRVADSGGRVTLQAQPISIFPWLQGIVGEGKLDAAGARADQPTLMFRLAAPLALAEGKAQPFTFVLQGRLAFKGEQLERVSRKGNTVSLEGTGKLNGKPGYRFRIDARDGQHGGAMEADRLTVRIEHADPGASASTARIGQAVLSYGLADSKSAAGQAAREGILPPTALRLVQ